MVEEMAALESVSVAEEMVIPHEVAVVVNTPVEENTLAVKNEKEEEENVDYKQVQVQVVASLVVEAVETVALEWVSVVVVTEMVKPPQAVVVEEEEETGD